MVRDAARTLLNVWVDCRTASSLSLDATDTVAAAALSEGVTVCSSYDEVVKLLARNLVDCFVVVYDRVGLFESLRLELHPDSPSKCSMLARACSFVTTRSAAGARAGRARVVTACRSPTSGSRFFVE